MTFRAGKRHKVQESGRSKSVLKLASKFQYFVNTGKISKRDLKAIDDQIYITTLDHAGKVLQLLDQLKEHVPKGKGKEILEQACKSWIEWLAELDSKKKLGYLDLKVGNDESRGAILDTAIDADTDLFRMLSALNSTLAASVRKASYEVPNSSEILTSVAEILDAYEARKKIISKLCD